MYLDLNRFIYFARINADADASSIPEGTRDLLEAARRACREQRAAFPLSGEHIWELGGIKDPAQRSNIADVMEELSGFQYLMGRTSLAHLEAEAGLQDVYGETRGDLPLLPLIRPTFGWAFGMRGGIVIRDADGNDVSEQSRREMGDEKYTRFMTYASRTMERAMLDGPSDEEEPALRAEYGYQPEKARQSQLSRLAFDADYTHTLDAHPKWRRGRLRDAIAAREFAHEWLDTLNRINADRAARGLPSNPSDDDMRRLMAGMPHVQVAISMKTRYHRDRNHRWTTNDIVDIDALSVAYAYCDAVFTDRAARAALANSRELRPFGTYLPRTPKELADWLDRLPTSSAPEMMVPASGRRFPLQSD
ncbi:MAG: hypothetical protein WB797_05740 [Nocardioides sp.]